MTIPERRPTGITALSIFFFAGASISFIAAVSLALPGSFLEPMWRLNPRAHEAFAHIGLWAAILMFAVSACCAFAGIGLWRIKRWGHRLAVGMIAVNMLGDIANVLTGTEPRAVVGIPVAAAILLYLLSEKIRRVFE